MENKILILDNYDSFTYNLVHMVKKLTTCPLDVRRNDEITLEEIATYDLLILSPGPGIPDEAGILKKAIQHYADKMPIFGVCLGMQAIVEVFGGEIVNMNQVFHGIGSPMKIQNENAIIFKDISDGFIAGRYHSWVASQKKFPEELEVTCVDEKGEIMAIQHKKYAISAVQFHPESILTEVGETLVANFLEYHLKTATEK